MPDTQVTRLRDGRDLAWVEVGAEDGTPVFAFHGTPESRLQLSFDAAAPRESGVRLIVPDRPGYGLSTYHRRRRLTDWADDAAQLATHLDIDRFAVVGVSGGGPHALVCGALLPDRVSAVGVVAGVDAVHERGSEAAMMPVTRERLLPRTSSCSPATGLPARGHHRPRPLLAGGRGPQGAGCACRAAIGCRSRRRAAPMPGGGSSPERSPASRNPEHRGLDQLTTVHRQIRRR